MFEVLIKTEEFFKEALRRLVAKVLIPISFLERRYIHWMYASFRILQVTDSAMIDKD